MVGNGWFCPKGITLVRVRKFCPKGITLDRIRQNHHFFAKLAFILMLDTSRYAGMLVSKRKILGKTEASM